MIQKWLTPHTTNLSLLLSMVFYSNGLVIACENFFSNTLTMVISLVSLTCFFLLFSGCLTMKESFHKIYWDFFNLVAAILLTTDASINWNFTRWYVLLFLGILSLSLYTVYLFLTDKGQDQDQTRPVNATVPFAIELSFVFIGHGVATMGRWFVPLENNLDRKLAVGGIMLVISALFFYYFYVQSSSEVEPSPSSTHPTKDEHTKKEL